MGESPGRALARRRGIAVAAALLLVPAMAAGRPAAARRSLDELCDVRGASPSVAARAGHLAPGTLLAVQQKPAAVHFGYSGKIRYRDLAVMGDFETVGFRIDSFTGSRTFSVSRSSRYVNPAGDVISLFDFEGTLEEWVVLPFSRRTDMASPVISSDLLYLGPPGQEQPYFMPVMVLPKKLPRSRVVRHSDRLQYASNLINVAVPGLHRRQLDEPGHLGFEEQEIVEIVASELGGFDYDEIGIGNWQHLLTNSGAYHRNPSPGSGAVPVSYYTSTAFHLWQLWKHEIGHNWNFRYDLPGLVGWEAPFDGAHSRGTVAREPGMLCCSAYPIRRRGGRWQTVWIRDPHPFHPLELFAMGLIPASEVPEMRVFKRQDLRDYRPNEVLRGPTRPLTVEQVVATYGLPEPAAANVWRVAPVVVSETLLPKRWVRALNFYMRRIEDPDGTVPASFDRATRGLLDLQTTIAVPGGSPPAPPKDVTFPEIGKQEVPGVKLSRAIPGCIRPGEKVVVAGRTNGGLPLEAISLVPSNPDTRPVEVPVAADAGGGFRVELTPTAEDAYQVLFDPLWSAGPVYVTEECPG
ncbi:MAG: hypothetical protein R3325_11425 [Thermoanaerobaculia bacterium]|nr:hypothetical protein [Thermoanaerobaculia bacterium]